MVHARKESLASSLTVSPANRAWLGAPQQRLAACQPGRCPWDDWEAEARAAGLPRELASLGRAVMRQAYEQSWPRRLQSLCGWSDGGRRMLNFALRSPAKARYRWGRLLESAGRGRPAAGRWTTPA